MANYGVKYRLEYVDLFGNPCKIDILQKAYIGPVFPYEGGSEPITLTYKNENDLKYNPISGCEATITLLTSDSLSLKDFYTSDEREYQVRSYKNDELKFAGYIIPDGCSEPFSAPPFESKLQATDVIGSLKSVSYTTPGGGLIKKVDSFKNILKDCLEFTNLELDFNIAVNIRAINMGSGNPLELAYIDTQRFIDTSNRPFSVYDVIKYVASQFTATLRQVNGAFWLINTSELGTAQPAARYNSSGAKIGDFTFLATPEDLGGLDKPNSLINADHNTSIDKAYGKAAAYFQYNYFANKIQNGSFDEVTSDGSGNWTGFPGWEMVGDNQLGRDWDIVQNTAWDDVSKQWLPIDSWAYYLTHWQWERGIRSSAINVNDTDSSLSISFTVQSTEERPDNDIILRQIWILIALRSGTFYYNGESNAWEEREAVLTAKVQLSEAKNKASYQRDIPRPPQSGPMYLEIRSSTYGFNFNDTWQAPVVIDDISVNVQENQYFKAPIGEVSSYINTASYTYEPDAHVVMFGDGEANTRNDWIRLSDGTPTQKWNRPGKTDELKLIEILGKNIINHYQKPGILLEGSIDGLDISPNDIYSISGLPGKLFFIIKGTFNAKSGSASVTLAELFTEDSAAARVDTFLDYGNFKNSDGSSVGSPSGVSVTLPPGSESSHSHDNLSTLNKLNDAEGYLLISGVKVKAGLADEATHALDSDHADNADHANNSDEWDGHYFDGYLDQPVLTTSDVAHKSVSSKVFTSGFSGSGWRIDNQNTATVDNLVVRKSMSVYELIISRIRATNGSVWISDSAKAAAVTEITGGSFEVAIDTDDGNQGIPFVVNDIVKCQTWSGRAIKQYTARVSIIGTDSFVITDITGTGSPAEGDEIVRIGNTTDVTRQGSIYLTAAEDDNPYIDIIDGVTSGDLTGKTKARMGKLTGISDADFGGALEGYGLYANNVYLKGKIIVTGGNSVTQESIIEGGYIKTSLLDVDTIRAEIIDAEQIVVDGGGVLESTIIEGGHIKTELIDVTDLFAQSITATDFTVTGGQIGGFEIDASSMQTAGATTSDPRFVLLPSGTDGFMAFIDGTNKWAGIGANVFPSSTGVEGLARFENNTSNPSGSNYVMYLKASGGNQNTALWIAGGDIRVGSDKGITGTLALMCGQGTYPGAQGYPDLIIGAGSSTWLYFKYVNGLNMGNTGHA